VVADTRIHPPLLGDRQRAACFYSEFAEVTA
ncbi:hypothetical protein ACQR75_23545, partial [Klebsiella pneumoniae]